MSVPQPAQRRPLDPDAADVAAAQRDRAAFAVLYRRYLDRVYGFAYHRLGDHHDAEDATERTFLEAMRALGRYRDDGPVVRCAFFVRDPDAATVAEKVGKAVRALYDY